MIFLKSCQTRWSRQKNMLICSWAFVFFLIVFSILVAIIAGNCTPKAAHWRKMFWVDSQYVFKTTLNETILMNQMYAKQLTSINDTKHSYSLIFVHDNLFSKAICSNYILRFNFVFWSWHCSTMIQQIWRKNRLSVLHSRSRLWNHFCRYHHCKSINFSKVIKHNFWRDCWTDSNWFHSIKAF